MRLHIIVTLFILLFSRTVALGQQLTYGQFFIDKGLSQSQVTCMAIDNYGYIWLGTDGGGLDYFDGNKFKNIGTEQGLSYSRIVSVIATNDNRVICGLKHNFFSVIRHDTIINHNHDPKYGSTTITAFAQQNNGYIWLGNDKGDIFKILSDTIYLYQQSVGSQITSMTFTHDQSLYISTTNGLYQLKDQQVIEEHFFSDIGVTCVKENIDQIMWVATEKGLAYGTSNRWTWDNKFNTSVKSLITDIIAVSTEEIWFSTYGSGVYRWDRYKNFCLNSENGLPNQFCTTILRDKAENIWIGTDGGGLIKYSGNQFIHYLKRNNPIIETVMSITQDKNKNYWLGTFGQGITIIDNKGQVSSFHGNHQIPSKVVICIEHLKDGSVLVGCKQSEVVQIDSSYTIIKPFCTPENERIIGAIVIKEDSSGRIWFGTSNSGIYIVGKDKVLKLDKELPSQKIKSISVTNKHIAWIGSEDAGAFSIDQHQIDEYFNSQDNKEKKINCNRIKITQNNLICGIDYDTRKNLWIGTFDLGLFCIKPDGSYNHYTKSTGILSNNIYSVLSTPDGSVWVGTEHGVHEIIYRQPSDEPYIQTYGIEHGFTGLECNLNALYQDKQGRIWIGNITGVSVFNAQAATSKITKANLHFTNISTSKTGKTHYYPVSHYSNEAIILPYSNNNITFNFKAIDLNIPLNTVYLYRLDNLDKGWITSVAEGRATYSFIPPGKYIFRVKAASGDGVRSEHDLAVQVIVKPPFWRTKLFIALTIVIIATTISLILRYRQLSLIRRNKQLTELVESRTVELQLETMRVQQQAQNLAKINEELKKLSIVISKTDNVVLIANKNLEWEWVNEGFEKKYGYTFDEHIKLYGKNVIRPESSQKHIESVEYVLEHKKSATYRNRVHNKQGDDIWVQSTITPIYDETNSDQLQMLVVIETDVTHIQKINNELRKLSLVASKTDNAVIIMNKHGEIEWVNDGFLRMYDLSAEESKRLFNTTIFELHSDITSLRQINKMFHTSQTQTFVSKRKTSSGSEKWIQTVLTPIIMENGEYEYIIAVDADLTRIKAAEEQIVIEKENVDKLLRNILPEETAEELKSQGFATPRYYKSVTVMFADVKSFSKYCQSLKPQELLNQLHEYFNEFDEIVSQNYVEKIKTVGDAYMCAGGLPIINRSHAFNILLVGLQIQNKVKEINKRKLSEGIQTWEFRVGVHTGEIISGVIGKQKFAYDIWGDTVNIASRMESSCEEGRVNISGDTYQIIKDFFDCEYRGKIEIKNRGRFDMYFVNGIKPEYSENGNCVSPNDIFKRYLAEL